MRFLNIKDVSPTDYLAVDVTSFKGHLLAKAGIPLDTKVLQRLTQNGVHSIYVTDDLTELIKKDFGLSEEMLLKDVIDPKLRQEFNSKVKTAMEKFKTTEDSRYSAGGDILYSTMRMISDSIISEIQSSKDYSVNMLNIKHFDTYNYEHSVNTAILSIMVGAKSGFTDKELEILAMGSLLMNIGKDYVDQGLLSKESVLSDSEHAQIKEHSKLGRQLLSDRSLINGFIKNVVLNHHERLDGSGYPRGLKGDDIDKFTRIVSICDVYDAMTSDRPYRKAFFQNEALEYLMGSSNLFDLTYSTIFAKNIVIFPIGTYVLLSNGEPCIVLQNNKDLPMRPLVKNLFKRETIDLSRNTNLTILKIIKKLDNYKV